MIERVDSSVERCRSVSSMRSKRSEEHTSELQSRSDLVCRLLLEKKKKQKSDNATDKPLESKIQTPPEGRCCVTSLTTYFARRPSLANCSPSYTTRSHDSCVASQS